MALSWRQLVNDFSFHYLCFYVSEGELGSAKESRKIREQVGGVDGEALKHHATKSLKQKSASQ